MAAKRMQVNPCSAEGLSLVALGLRRGCVKPAFMREAARATAWAWRYITALEEQAGLREKIPEDAAPPEGGEIAFWLANGHLGLKHKEPAFEED